MRSGHIVLDGDGRLTSLDHGFTTIMQTDFDLLLGRPVLDITAPADRAECGAAITKLRETRVPFEVSKRFIRDNGTLVWVTNTVSLVGNGRDTDLIVATISPITETDETRAPALLLDSARILASLNLGRLNVVDRSVVSDVAWDAMLAAYIAEAEGRAITIQGLANKLGISDNQANRWISVLIGQRLVEIETRETDPFAPKSFRLTNKAHTQLEDHLAKAGALVGLSGPKRLFAE